MVSTTSKKPEGVSSSASKYLREVWLELKKTSWPSYDELKKSTALVLGVIVIVAVWIGGLDFIFGTITRRFVGW